MPTIMVIFVLATYVQNFCWTHIFLTLILWSIYFLDHNFFGPNFIWTQNIFWSNTFRPYVFWTWFFFNQQFFGPNFFFANTTTTRTTTTTLLGFDTVEINLVWSPFITLQYWNILFLSFLKASFSPSSMLYFAREIMHSHHIFHNHVYLTLF